MMDVNYFIEEASCFNQEEFEINFADVIEVFDTNETHLTTEDRKKLIINWNNDGTFKSYFVSQDIDAKIAQIIDILEDIEVDGETMQYILNKVGMQEQMLKQLIMSQPIEEVRYLIEEREEIEEEFEYEGDIEDLQGN